MGVQFTSFPQKVDFKAKILGGFMDQIRKTCNIAIFFSSILAFFLWETIFDFENILSNFFANSLVIQVLSYPLKWFISFISSYGLFNFLFTKFTSFFSKSTKIKKRVLREVYVEGTWAVFYYMYGELRLELETFKQDLLSAQCIGVGYSSKGENLGQFIKDPIFIDEKAKQLTAAYTDKSVSRHQESPGYSKVFLLPNRGKPPIKFTGRFFQLGMKKQIDCIGFKLTLEEIAEKNDYKKAMNCFAIYKEEADIYLSVCKNEKAEVY